MENLTICVIGFYGSGKTTFINKVKGIKTDSVLRTHKVQKTQISYTYDDKKVNVVLIDTQGFSQQGYGWINQIFEYQNFMLVIDAHSPEGQFKNVESAIQQLQKKSKKFIAFGNTEADINEVKFEDFGKTTDLLFQHQIPYFQFDFARDSEVLPLLVNYFLTKPTSKINSVCVIGSENQMLGLQTNFKQGFSVKQIAILKPRDWLDFEEEKLSDLFVIYITKKTTLKAIEILRDRILKYVQKPHQIMIVGKTDFNRNELRKIARKTQIYLLNHEQWKISLSYFFKIFAEINIRQRKEIQRAELRKLKEEIACLKDIQRAELRKLKEEIASLNQQRQNLSSSSSSQAQALRSKLRIQTADKEKYKKFISSVQGHFRGKWWLNDVEKSIADYNF